MIHRLFLPICVVLTLTNVGCVSRCQLKRQLIELRDERSVADELLVERVQRLEDHLAVVEQGLVSANYRGYQVFGDEILVIDPAKRMLLPHPRCFVVKQPGFDLFPQLRGLYRTRSPQKVGRSLNVWYVDPSEIRSDSMATAAPCRTLIFPRFRKGSGTDLAPVSEIDVVGRLLSYVFTFFPNTEASLSGVAALARDCEAFELRFGDLRNGFDAIDELLAKGRPA